jgi:hypothetical protein
MLLKCQVAVDGNEGVELPGRSRKKRTVADTCPTKSGYRGNVVAANVAGEPAIDTFVEQ